MNNKLHDYKVGCISAGHAITWTGIFLLIWAFGSYVVYVLTTQDPILCFPPVSGCVSISHAGNFPLSGLFYRLLVLPLAPLLGLSMYFVIQFLKNMNPNLHPNIKRILFILGCIILPIALIVTEAFKDGHQFHPSYISDLHRLFAGIAFLSFILFQIVTSFQLLKIQKIFFYKFMLFLSFLPIFIIIFQSLTNIQHINDIVEWNVFVALMVWSIFIGLRIKNHG